MRSPRIKSFTLIEMVFAMLFAAIVVGMAYTSITIFSRLYENYRLKRSGQADQELINQAIIRDFNRSSLIEIANKQIDLKDSSGAFTLQYRIEKNYLLRFAALKTDSIKMENLAFKGSFQGHEVKAGIIDQIVLNFNSDELPIIISARKNYSAVELFRYEDSLEKSSLISPALWKQ
jgi:type II secretory pathway component PulJ